MVSDAYRFLVPLSALAVLFFVLGHPAPGGVLAGLAAFVAFFFRNPDRAVPTGPQLVVSPADGKVVRVVPLDEFDGTAGGHSISIFLSVFDVHVNRAPIGGQLEGLAYKRGRFKAAFDDEASRVNEQNILTFRGDRGAVLVRQIAGLIARRVVCWKQPGDSVARGEVFGLIRFGSRVDVVLPVSARVRVKVGDRVKGGSSVLAEYR
jgi:phosphatidylserine decarboxylase